MFTKLRHRILIIAALLIGSGLALWHNYRRTTTPDRPGQPVSLGLDLQGGMHLALELDQRERPSADPARDLESALTVLRKRVDQFGVLEPLIQQVGKDRIVVELPGLRDPERAKAIVRQTAFLEFRFTDETGALERAVPSMDRAIRELGLTLDAGAPTDRSAVEQLLGGDSARVAERQPAVLAKLIGPGSVAGLHQMPGEYAVPSAQWARVDSLLRHPEIKRLIPRGIDLRWSATDTAPYRLLYAIEDKPIITGTSLENAQAQTDPTTNRAEVNFQLDRAGGRKFGVETGRHVGDYLAIVLDGRVQGRPPVIENQIHGQGRIQMGGRALKDAQDLALVLRAGSLPTPLRIVEERQVGPSLGEDSINDGLKAGLVGTGMVTAIMVGYYGWSGVIAVAALTLYSVFTFGTLALFGATLTLPGLAGFVLSIGMAVDANVLIFERIREELDLGRGPRLALAEGFKHAMPAIIDSNLTTVLTALFLFQFGTGPIRGFAITMIVGILASMVTAVFVTRTFFLIWMRNKTDQARLSVGSLRLFRGAAFDFIKTRRIAYAVTAVMLAVGVGFVAARGVRSSVDFTSGTLHQITVERPFQVPALRQALEQRGLPNAEVQRFGKPNEFIVRAGLVAGTQSGDELQAASTAVKGALEETVGSGQYHVGRTEAVGPKVGSELRSRAALAIVLSFGAVLAYLAYRFEWRFGLAAVAATAHDILATLAFIAVLDIEISLVVVAAILTMVGYSLNDTIVIFDRVRENQRGSGRAGLAEVINRSVNETLPRTILTGGTALVTLVALAVFGGEVIRPFALVMFFGIFTGTFSSIFIAAPILAYVHERWPATKRSTAVQAQGVAIT